MSEERLKEIQDSIDFQIKIGGKNILVSEEQELLNEVKRLKEELEIEKDEREHYQAIVESWE